jgi:hypothetical protein
MACRAPGPRINGGSGALPVLLISSLLCACGGGGGTGGVGGTVEGYVIDGPVNGALINCFEMDSNGQPTTQINIDPAQTGASGSFTLPSAVNVSDPVLCTSTGGTDTDTLDPAVDLSVMIPGGVPKGMTVTANLTPLTTVATQVVQNGGAAATAQEIMNTLTDVADEFGLTGTDLLTLVPSSSPSATPEQQKYDQILTDLINITVGQSVTMDVLIESLANDVGSDLALDGLTNIPAPKTPVPLGGTTLDLVPEFQVLLDTVIEMGFTPDPTSCTPPNCVSMARNATESTAGVLAIDVKANNITAGNVFGAAFDVDIQNTTVTQWNGSGVMTCTEVAPTPLGCATGNFLEAQPPVNYLVNLSGGINTLVVGATEISPATGVTGDGTIMTIITLKFKKIGMQGDASTLSFAANSLNDSSANPIGGISWSAGTITVTY